MSNICPIFAQNMQFKNQNDETRKSKYIRLESTKPMGLKI